MTILKGVREWVSVRVLACLMAVIGGLALPALGWAAEGDLTVAAPTFDWTALGTVIAAIMAVTVGIFVFRKIKGVIR